MCGSWSAASRVNARLKSTAALAQLSLAVARTDPERATRLAESITDHGLKLLALANVASAVAGSDPRRAARLAHTVHWAWRKHQVSKVLPQLVPRIARADLDRAVSMAKKIISSHERGTALTEVAAAAAPHDPQRALHLADLAERTASERPGDSAATVAQTLAPARGRGSGRR